MVSGVLGSVVFSALGQERQDALQDGSVVGEQVGDLRKRRQEERRYDCCCRVAADDHQRFSPHCRCADSFAYRRLSRLLLLVR